MNQEFSFYHIKVGSITSVLTSLLVKTLDADIKSLVHSSSDIIIDKIDKELWDTTSNIFIPHGKSQDEFPQKQPVLLTNKQENTNNSDFLFLISDSDFKDFSSFKRIFVIFNDAEEDQILWARGLYKNLKDQNKNMNYWLQDENRKWKKQN